MSEFLNDANYWFQALRPTFGAAIMLFGAILTVIGSIGVLRFPDFYTRLHAASITDTSGATLCLIGMAFMSPDWFVVIKLITIWIFLFLTSPTASHAIANAAYKAELEPKIGPYDQMNLDEETTV